jgi:hypothetical protein
MLSEDEVREIREGMKAGVRGPVVVTWVERLLKDRDERLRRDRALAAQLLAPNQSPDGP